MKNYIYGPINSRRLGKSLGIDIIGQTGRKNCNFNCIYCECGEEETISSKRMEFVPFENVIKELKEKIRNNIDIDYITFSGAGEPTLNIELGKYIKAIKDICDIKICVITNSSVIYDEKVRRELLDADVVMPSLDAISESTFNLINKPHKDINIDDICDGLLKFSKEYTNKILLEIFLIEGINDSESELSKFCDFINIMKPTEVFLNSLDRCAPVKWVKKMDGYRINEIKNYFEKHISNIKINTI